MSRRARLGTDAAGRQSGKSRKLLRFLMGFLLGLALGYGVAKLLGPKDGP